MKVKPLFNYTNATNFLRDYLFACGVKDVKSYIDANTTVYNNSWTYPNIKLAVDRLEYAISCGEKIGILQDSDCDGIMSAALIADYIQQFGNNEIIPFFHKAKAHGLRKNPDEDIVNDVINSNINLLIIPDASTADVKEHNFLHEYGIDCLVFDHHDESSEGSLAIVVNNNHDHRLNKAISGTGVTEKVVMAHWSKYGQDKIARPNYKDMVAVSLISDICNMTSAENRRYIIDGFALIAHKFYGNPMIKLLTKKLNRRGMTQSGFSWGAIPPINALCRSSNQDDKLLFFNAMIGKEDIEQGLRVIKKAHRYQKDVVPKIESDIKPTLDNCHKVLIGFTEPEYKTYIGLVANKLCGESGKPTLLLREADDNTWSGSMRSPIDIKDQINETGLATVQGHNSAAGIFIAKDKLNDLISWFDNQELDIDPPIIVTSVIKSDDIDLSLCHACVDNNIIWSGSDAGGIPQPKFYIEFESYPNIVSIFEKHTNTIRFNFPNCSIVKFSANEQECEMVRNRNCKIKAIINLDINNWNNIESAQGLVDKWEIEPIDTNDDMDWESLFK